MCFYIQVDSEKNREKKVAKKDIICYKHGYLDKTDLVFKTSYRRFSYNLNTLYELEGSWPFEYSNRLHYHYYINQGCIYQGFHSHSDKKIARQRRLCYRETIIKCIIPKGTEYYYNSEDKEYVSKALIVTGETITFSKRSFKKATSFQ